MRRLVVARTRDGARSFDVLTEGLPQSHAYDLVYRHGLAVDETGTCLAMGSTTGHLWVSENAGDSWTLVAGHLPPISCVRSASADLALRWKRAGSTDELNCRR